MKLLELMVKLAAVLLLVIAMFLIAIWIGVESSGCHVFLSKIGGVSRSGDRFSLDVTSEQRGWTILIALSKGDLERMRQMDGWIEIAIENPGDSNVHISGKILEDNDLPGRPIGPGERRVIFNGLISDYLTNYEYLAFMDDSYYPDPSYSSYFIMNIASGGDVLLDLVIKSSDDITFENEAIVFGFIPKDSI